MSGRQSHSGAKFSKVLDGRKQPIRGLWIRGSRFYARLTVEDPTTGVKEVRRGPLVDKDGKPATTTPQAVAIMERLKVNRIDGDLPTVHRCPKFADYVTTYLDFIAAGSGLKKASTISKDTTTLAGWAAHVGQMRLDQIKPAHVNSACRLTDRHRAGMEDGGSWRVRMFQLSLNVSATLTIGIANIRHAPPLPNPAGSPAHAHRKDSPAAQEPRRTPVHPRRPPVALDAPR